MQCAVKSRANLEALARDDCALVAVLALLLRRVAPVHLTARARRALFALATSADVSAEPLLSSAIWYPPTLPPIWVIPPSRACSLLLTWYFYVFL